MSSGDDSEEDGPGDLKQSLEPPKSDMPSLSETINKKFNSSRTDKVNVCSGFIVNQLKMFYD